MQQLMIDDLHPTPRPRHTHKEKAKETIGKPSQVKSIKKNSKTHVNATYIFQGYLKFCTTKPNWVALHLQASKQKALPTKIIQNLPFTKLIELFWY